MTFEQMGGAALMALFLADIFLTVLYARAGTGLLAPHWNRCVWLMVSGVAKMAGRYRSAVLSFAGPLIVIALIAFWALGLTLAAAFIVRPELGTTIRPSSGETPTDLVTALLVAGNSLSIVGGGDYAPHSSGTRLLFLVNSLIGASVLSLVLSYLVQVYSALHERNAFALTIDLMTGETGDAAKMLTRLSQGGDFSDATSTLDNLVRPLAMIKEAHHFYPLLFYFRFNDPRYAVTRFVFILLDLATLIETGLDPKRHRAFICPSPVDALHRCAALLLETLDQHLAAGNRATALTETRPCEERYETAAATLRAAGIEPLLNHRSYADRRGEWEPSLARVGQALGYTVEESDCRQRAARTPTQRRATRHIV